MDGRRIFPMSKPRSPTSLLLVLLLSLLALFSIFSSSSSSYFTNPNSNPNSFPSPNYSFVSSLEKFLTIRSPSPPSYRDGGREPDSAEELDRLISKRKEIELSDPSVIRVYVYEMPHKFTYDLLWLFRNTYKETVNLTSNGSPVHRLIEQHSIDYWLWSDLIALESERLIKNVIRVHRQEEADFFYIPFFATISFFLMEKQQCKALYRVCAYA